MDGRVPKINNSSVLIQEVKKHVVLYDNKAGNSNPELKKRSWEAVAEALFGERWNQYGSFEKEGIVREIQTKWKSLRDNFTRVLRKEKEDELSGNTTKRKKYIYYDDLLFLAPYTSFRKSALTDDLLGINGDGDSKRGLSNIIFINENRDSKDSNDFITHEENPLQNPLQPTISSMQPVQLIQLQPNSTQLSEDDDATNVNRRVANVLEQVVAMQKDEKLDDPMGNKKFLLSLLPFMRKLPDDVNLEVRLQLMSVLQNYTGGKSVL